MKRVLTPFALTKSDWKVLVGVAIYFLPPRCFWYPFSGLLCPCILNLSRSFILSPKPYRLTSRVVNFVTDLMKISLLYGLARRRSGRGARAKGCLGGDFLSLEV